MLLDKNLTTANEVINLENGRFKLHNFTITDTHKLESATMEEVLLYSSNIGMAKIAQRLSPAEYNAGLQAFDRDIISGEIMLMCTDGILDSNVEYKNKENSLLLQRRK